MSFLRENFSLFGDGPRQNLKKDISSQILKILEVLRDDLSTPQKTFLLSLANRPEPLQKFLLRFTHHTDWESCFADLQSYVPLDLGLPPFLLPNVSKKDQAILAEFALQPETAPIPQAVQKIACQFFINFYRARAQYFINSTHAHLGLINFSVLLPLLVHVKPSYLSLSPEEQAKMCRKAQDLLVHNFLISEVDAVQDPYQKFLCEFARKAYAQCFPRPTHKVEFVSGKFKNTQNRLDICDAPLYYSTYFQALGRATVSVGKQAKEKDPSLEVDIPSLLYMPDRDSNTMLRVNGANKRLTDLSNQKKICFDAVFETHDSLEEKERIKESNKLLMAQHKRAAALSNGISRLKPQLADHEPTYFSFREMLYSLIGPSLEAAQREKERQARILASLTFGQRWQRSFLADTRSQANPIAYGSEEAGQENPAVYQKRRKWVLGIAAFFSPANILRALVHPFLEGLEWATKGLYRFASNQNNNIVLRGLSSLILLPTFIAMASFWLAKQVLDPLANAYSSAVQYGFLPSLPDQPRSTFSRILAITGAVACIGMSIACIVFPPLLATLKLGVLAWPFAKAGALAFASFTGPLLSTLSIAAQIFIPAMVCSFFAAVVQSPSKISQLCARFLAWKKQKGNPVQAKPAPPPSRADSVSSSTASSQSAQSEGQQARQNPHHPGMPRKGKPASLSSAALSGPDLVTTDGAEEKMGVPLYNNPFALVAVQSAAAAASHPALAPDSAAIVSGGAASTGVSTAASAPTAESHTVLEVPQPDLAAIGVGATDSTAESARVQESVLGSTVQEESRGALATTSRGPLSNGVGVTSPVSPVLPSAPIGGATPVRRHSATDISPVGPFHRAAGRRSRGLHHHTARTELGEPRGSPRRAPGPQLVNPQHGSPAPEIGEAPSVEMLDA